jgi:hypothetical protein
VQYRGIREVLSNKRTRQRDTRLIRGMRAHHAASYPTRCDCGRIKKPPSHQRGGGMVYLICMSILT